MADYDEQAARDISIGLQHFSSAFLLIILASLIASLFGITLPLLAFAGAQVARSLVVGGILAALVLVVAYFACELIHYRILSNRLLHDSREWGREVKLVVVAVLVALAVFVTVRHQFSDATLGDVSRTSHTS